MKLLITLALLYSSTALACWKLQGDLSFNKETIKIEQKMDHDKTYSFMSGPYQFHVKIPSKFELPPHAKEAKDVHLIEINVEEKNGIALKEVAHGNILVKTGNQATMTTEDNENGDKSVFNLKLTEI